jgi:hypothetical protein
LLTTNELCLEIGVRRVWVVHLIRWYAAVNVVSYRLHRPKRLEELEERLRTGNFGSSPGSIVSFCKRIAQLNKQLSRKELTLLLERNKISHKRWDELCDIGEDLRLGTYSNKLPSTLNAIYALTTLSKNELNDGMMSGELNDSMSSEQIYTYAKIFRLREEALSNSSNVLPCYLAIGSGGERLNGAQIERLLNQANESLVKHGIILLANASSTTKFLEKQKELIAKEKKQGVIETEIEHQMYMNSGGLSEHYSHKEIDRIMEGDMSQFARAIMLISNSRIEMMETYGQLYCYKIALEYHRSDSRVQRYNYKRRLVHVQQKYRFLSPVVDKIFNELIERPRGNEE